MSASCDKCFNHKPVFICGICKEAVCKKCVSFVEEEAFAFASQKPEVACHDAYCATCFESHVASEISKYETTVEKARQMRVFFKGEGKAVRALSVKKQESPIAIKACADHDELILRLAYQATVDGFNVLVDMDLKSEKVRNAGYVHLIWHGSAIPCTVDPSRFDRKDVEEKFKHLLPY